MLATWCNIKTLIFTSIRSNCFFESGTKLYITRSPGGYYPYTLNDDGCFVEYQLKRQPNSLGTYGLSEDEVRAIMSDKDYCRLKFMP